MFHLFFSHLGIGLLGCLTFVPFKRLGRGFFRFNALLALAFLTIAAASSWNRTPLPWVLFVAIFLAIAYVISLGFKRSRVSPFLLLATVVTGIASILLEVNTLASSADTSVPPLLLAAHFLTSAVLLGSVTLDMILGHWYLVIPGLSFGHLRRMTLLFAIALALRLAVLLWSVVVSWDTWTAAWQLDATRFLLEHGFFLTLRVLFGIIGPLVLVYLVWECVRIGSNTSATGILYVATAVVLIGEIAAKYFLTASAILL